MERRLIQLNRKNMWYFSHSFVHFPLLNKRVNLNELGMFQGTG